MQHKPITAIDFSNSGDDSFTHGNFHNAIHHYTRAIELTPIGSNSDLVNIYNKRATAYFHLTAYDNAIAQYTKAIVLDPNNPTLFINRSIAHHANGQES